MSYSNISTTHTYDYLLNGRWHTGFRPTPLGQLEVQERLIKLSGMNSRSRVLDFGSGTGRVTCDYAILTGASVIGVSSEPHHIALSRELVQSISKELMNWNKPAFGVVRYEKGGKLPFPDSYFDIVVYTESMCHVHDKPGLFREFRRVLRNSGKMVGEDWSFQNGNTSLADQIDTVYGTRLVTCTKTSKLLRKAGFSCVNVKWVKPVWNIGTLVYLKDWVAFKWRYSVLETRITDQDGPLDMQLIRNGTLLEHPDFCLQIVCAS